MRHRRVALGLWLLIAVCAGIVVARMRLRTDMAAFLPASSSPAQQVLTEQANNGASSRIVLLAIEGAPPATLAALSKSLAARLRRDRAFIEVANGDDASIRGIRDFFWRHRYLLAGDITADRFTVHALHAALARDLALLGSDMAPLVEETLPGDPTGEIFTLLRRLAPATRPHSRDGVWLSSDERRALLMVHTRAAAFDIDGQAHALALIHHAFDDARRALPAASGARLRESGPAVFAVSARDETVRDATRLSILATAITTGLLLFAYRSLRVLLLGLVPVVSGGLAAVAGVSLGFGFVHGITLGFGVTLIGESVDYAIYLFTQTARGEAPSGTIARIWPTLRLCAATSIVGFGAMLFSSFVGFAQLGWFSIIGLIAATATTRFILPHLMPRNFFAAGAVVLGRPLLAAMAYRSRLRWLIALLVLGGGTLLMLHRGGFWDSNLMDLSPIPSAMQKLDRTLHSDLGMSDLRYFVVFRRATEQAALEESAALARRLSALVAHGDLRGYNLPSQILPAEKTQRARQAALPDAGTLRARFETALAGLPFRAASFAPFFKRIAATRSGPLVKRADLPPALALELDSMLVKGSAGWQVIAPLRNVTDPTAIARTLATTGLPDIRFVDLNQESVRLLGSFEHEATMLAVIGSAAIVFLLLLALRSLARVAAVVAPLVAALVVTATLLIAGGGKLTIFMMVGFLLTVAVGSNYCLFFERAYADAETQRRSIASVVLANLCTVSAYGAISLSRIPVLHDIGRTVAMGTLLSLFFAAILSTRDIEAKPAVETPRRSGLEMPAERDR